eukprot:scaffold22644_cov99-Phaeocystis_antarctica.AAC.5
MRPLSQNGHWHLQLLQWLSLKCSEHQPWQSVATQVASCLTGWVCGEATSGSGLGGGGKAACGCAAAAAAAAAVASTGRCAKQSSKSSGQARPRSPFKVAEDSASHAPL